MVLEAVPVHLQYEQNRHRDDGADHEYGEKNRRCVVMLSIGRLFTSAESPDNAEQNHGRNNKLYQIAQGALSFVATGLDHARLSRAEPSV